MRQTKGVASFFSESQVGSREYDLKMRVKAYLRVHVTPSPSRGLSHFHAEDAPVYFPSTKRQPAVSPRSY